MKWVDATQGQIQDAMQKMVDFAKAHGETIDTAHLDVDFNHLDAGGERICIITLYEETGTKLFFQMHDDGSIEFAGSK